MKYICNIQLTHGAQHINKEKTRQLSEMTRGRERFIFKKEEKGFIRKKEEKKKMNKAFQFGVAYCRYEP